MLKKNTLAFAIATVLGSTAAAAVAAEATGGLEEIVVTAQRRTESIQNVPITIQAISGDSLSQMSVSTFDDVIKLLPNVTFGSNGPGQGNIFMRGLSAGFAGNQSSASVAPMPNVATYLDDQALSFPARNADVYMADMERVEVLEGPQGTLFGGGAEAGAVRYITNKPKINVTEGSAEASYGTTAHGDPNTSITGVLNLPLAKDTLALRLVAYNDRRGGYIDNVASTFTRYPTDPGPAYWGVSYPTSALGGPATNNFALASRAQNPTSYQGLRASLLWQANDDWNVLLQQSYQALDAEGMNVQYPCGSDSVPAGNGSAGTCKPLGAWEETSFSPAYDKDKYSSTSWTVNGKLGDLRLVYTGSYLTRNIEQAMDYTNYARTAYGFYYTCGGGMMASKGGFSSDAIATAPCYTPQSSWLDIVHTTHKSHEFRVSTPDDWRLRGLVGAFWEELDIKDDQNFMYKSIPACNDANLAVALGGGPICLGNVQPVPGTASTDPSIRNDRIAYGQDLDRNFTQLAFFTSVDFDLIPKVLTLTGGTRYYRYAQSMYGSRYLTSTPSVNVPNGSVTADLIDLNTHRSDYSGFKSRANLTWHITPDIMAYYTFSQGFRAGAFNRLPSKKSKIYTIVNVDGEGNPVSVVGAVPTGVPISSVELGPNQAIISGSSTRQYQLTNTYPPDSLKNNEIGFKAELLNRRLVVNGSLYQMDWQNVQTLIYNPTVFGNSTFGIQGPDYQVKGFELQVAWKATDNLTLQGSLSHNDSKQTNSPCVKSVGAASGGFNPTPAGTCITAVKGLVDDGSGNLVAGNAAVENPLGAVGSTPAFSPKLQYNLRGHYDWMVNDYKAWAMVGLNHTDTMENTPSSFQAGVTTGYSVPTTTWLRYSMPAYTTYDAAIGVAKDNWTAELYGSNLSNVNASQFTSSGQWIRAEVPTRPRVLGIKIGMKF